ncbi:ATP synthase subunit a [Paraliobacillus quinghaiensis]|uniref:ATP synthase subunit a n=1 Tax=Paraliobacillus quinghaiensis TaxID=470815 RepID=A0A917WVH4_9BACI|nr:F0F1 ATP synthase subunit A [Paraliobacillus quinghaiensis]GGM32628.1 ATP synthase subunit a [Paraliobacillus quinghaiensis]
MDHESPIVHDFLGIPGFDFNASTVLMTFVASLIVFIIGVIGSRNLQTKPKGFQNVMEALVDFVKGIIGDAMDWRTGKMFLPLGLTLILYIFIANILGVITMGVYGHDLWWKSPTSDIGITLSLAGFVIVLSNFYGIKLKGIKGYYKDLTSPVAFILPFKLMEEFTNTMTLGFRLFGNIFAGEILLALIAKMAFIALPITFIGAMFPMMIWQGFSLFVGAIQAFIFTMLTMVYMSHKVADDH